jgi:hypothetical protein
MKLLTYKINTTTYGWPRGITENISLSLNNIRKVQKHTNVTHGASKELLASPEYTPKEYFASSKGKAFPSQV